jgi:hypothetical protein
MLCKFTCMLETLALNRRKTAIFDRIEQVKKRASQPGDNGDAYDALLDKVRRHKKTIFVAILKVMYRRLLEPSSSFIDRKPLLHLRNPVPPTENLLRENVHVRECGKILREVGQVKHVRGYAI